MTACSYRPAIAVPHAQFVTGPVGFRISFRIRVLIRLPARRRSSNMPARSPSSRFTWARITRRPGVVGLQLDSTVQVGQRLLVPAQFMESLTAAGQGRGVVGVEGDGPAQLGDGFLEPAGAPIGVTPFRSDPGVVGRERDRPVEIGERLVRLPPRAAQPSPAHQRPQVLAVDAQRTVEVGECLVVAAERLPAHGSPGQDFGRRSGRGRRRGRSRRRPPRNGRRADRSPRARR